MSHAHGNERKGIPELTPIQKNWEMYNSYFINVLRLEVSHREKKGEAQSLRLVPLRDKGGGKTWEWVTSSFEFVQEEM